MSQHISELLSNNWNRFKDLPGGKWLFSKAMGKVVPYSGNVGGLVLELKPGHAKVQITDRWAIRNHLKSVHAAAIMNTLELASGLAFNVGLPRDAKAIVTEFRVEYLKKARGTLIAECDCDCAASSEENTYQVTVNLKDAAKNVVAIGKAFWIVRPI